VERNRVIQLMQQRNVDPNTMYSVVQYYTAEIHDRAFNPAEIGIHQLHGYYQQAMEELIKHFHINILYDGDPMSGRANIIKVF
jgi:hypothetical protein